MSSLGSRREMGPGIERRGKSCQSKHTPVNNPWAPMPHAQRLGHWNGSGPDTLHSQGFLVMLYRTRDIGVLLLVHLKGNSACDCPAAKVLLDQHSRETLPDTLCKWRQQGQSPREGRTGDERGKRSFGDALS